MYKSSNGQIVGKTELYSLGMAIGQKDRKLFLEMERDGLRQAISTLDKLHE